MRDYDYELHLKMSRRAIACLVVVLCCWAGIWLLDWRIAVLNVVSNLFILLLGWFCLNLYPVKK